MLTYCKSLKFVEKPDYSFLQKCLEEVAKENGIKFDGIFDWTNNPAVKAKIESFLPTQDEIEKVRGTSVLKQAVKYVLLFLYAVLFLKKKRRKKEEKRKSKRACFYKKI
jgi:hypothetical protein